jgi:transcription initiation factor IIE alpha subunit
LASTFGFSNSENGGLSETARERARDRRSGIAQRGREVSGRVRETRLAKIRSFVHCVNKTMGFSFDNLPLEITCLKCGKQMNKTVKWLKAASQKCPSCDMVIDTAEFRRGVDEATSRTDEMIRNLENSLRSVKIKIHV